MLIDDVTIEAKSGKGGDGIVAWNKNMLSLGPTGGTGGRGGDVYVRGVANLGALKRYKNQKKFDAASGQSGGQQRRTGHDGEPLFLDVPVGTVVHNFATGGDTEITKVGEEVKMLSGGEGGRGNHSFRSSTNTSPEEFEVGKSGSVAELRLELKLIADVGFIGFPNAGKSTLLNALTNAKSKVANYAFTTLEPHLGVYYELILADIPGLIEGASSGKGLGIKFLRHIERTKVLFHFISVESEDVLKDYQTIRGELDKHNLELLEKSEYVFLSKSDLLDDSEEVMEKLNTLRKVNAHTYAISLLDDTSIDQVKKVLNTIKEGKLSQ